MRAKNNSVFPPALEAAGWLMFRAGIGSFMLTHGYPKLLKLFSDGPVEFSDPFGLGALASLALAVFAEFACSILIILGFKTRLTAVPLIITMAVAAFYAHGDDPFKKQELPLLYMLGFIALLVKGGGAYSLDALTPARRKARR